ncbi:MAG: T9SS type A sorting domain-containing protein, partial [Ignavibacteria bacterium]
GVESFAGSNVKSYSLSQNYPNPFNPSTIIKYSIPQNGYISLKVFNLQGEEVATLSEGVRQAGSYSVTFDASGLANGVYLYQLKSNGFMETKKLLLLK